ncbi:hypothetical protein ABER02_12390 [Rossellomorea marisflavi]|uniref:hypothetical protein n=1 Tax=Rossellomorea marisflavi TaxID=189381 RepID=UPI00064F76F8|nr:hypothetical protein [Rossellomorea marisflavi]KMK91107.1 hypothetical protein VL03_20640 [Rossellomorea marisflavi]
MNEEFLVNIILLMNVLIGVFLTLKTRSWWLPYILIGLTFLVLTFGFGVSLLLKSETILAYLFVFVVSQLIWVFFYVMAAHILSWVVRKVPFRHKQQIGWIFLIGFPVVFYLVVLM